MTSPTSSELTTLLVGTPQDILPSEITDLVQAWLEGRVKQIAIATELDDGRVCTFAKALVDGACRFKLLGAVTVLHDDILDEMRRPAAQEGDDASD